MTSAAVDVWADYVAAHPEFAASAAPPSDQFGFSAEMIDERLGLVLSGEKRTTAALLVDYIAGSRGMPGPGEHWLLVDGRGVPQAVLRTVVTRVGKLSSADEEFAYDYADGDRTAASWIEAHRPEFADSLPEDSEGVENEPIIFERFAVVWPEASTTDLDREWLAALG